MNVSFLLFLCGHLLVCFKDTQLEDNKLQPTNIKDHHTQTHTPSDLPTGTLSHLLKGVHPLTPHTEQTDVDVDDATNAGCQGHRDSLGLWWNHHQSERFVCCTVGAESLEIPNSLNEKPLRIIKEFSVQSPPALCTTFTASTHRSTVRAAACWAMS